MKYIKENLIRLNNYLESVCLSPMQCQGCNKNKCLVWYAQTVCRIELNSPNLMIRNGLNMIPTGDAKQYDQARIIEALAVTLQSCNECGGDHFDNCNINVLRLTLTHALIGRGDLFNYRGSVTLYLLNMVKINNYIGQRILSAYVSEKGRALSGLSGVVYAS